MLFPFLLLAGAASGQQSDHSVVAILRRQDQALLDATAPGDRATWDSLLTDDAIYLDENGTLFDRAALLASIVPLPANTSGSLTITNYSATITGDVGFVIHKDAEREDFHGQKLAANYIMSEVWRRTAGKWKLASVHAYVVAVDPPSIALPAESLDRLVGRYGAAADYHLEIKRDGDHLLWAINGGKSSQFLPETSQVFFAPGQPRIKFIFPEGKERPSSLIERREGEDIVWTRAR